MVVAGAVDHVDERVEQRRLAARPRSRDDDQAVGLAAERLDLGTEPDFVRGAHVGRGQMEDEAGTRLVVERHAAHASDSGNGAGPLGRGVRDELPRRKLEDEAFDVAVTMAPGSPRRRFALRRASSDACRPPRRPWRRDAAARAEQLDQRRFGRCRCRRSSRLRWLKLQWRTRYLSDYSPCGQHGVRVRRERRLSLCLRGCNTFRFGAQGRFLRA